MQTVSVVMATYNSENTIIESIESVLKQTFTDFEFIIVNDGSTDSTLEIIKDYAKCDRRIRFFDNKKNFGVSYSRNLAISSASGIWIAFIDSDDIWDSKKLEKQIELAKDNPMAVIFYTASAFIDWEGKRFEYIMPALTKIDYKELLKKNILSCSSVMVKKEVINEVKMSSDDMHEDYAAWLMILKKYKYAYGINEPLLIYRLSKKSKSSNRINSAKMIFKTYRYVGYCSVVSFFLAFIYSFHSIKKRHLIKKSRLE